MSDARRLIVIAFFIATIIYVIFLFSQNNFVVGWLRQPADKLAPYGVKILHLR